MISKRIFVKFISILSFLIFASNCFLLKEAINLEQGKNVPTYGPNQPTAVPKKAGGKTARLYASTKGKGEAEDISVFDVNKCSEDNELLCREKLNDLDLLYCHCYEDGNGEIVRCGYRGSGEKCKSPIFQ